MVALRTNILINAKLILGKKDKKAQLISRSPLRTRRSALDCSPIEEEKEEDNLLLMT
jgi:hypothetical protein